MLSETPCRRVEEDELTSDEDEESPKEAIPYYIMDLWLWLPCRKRQGMKIVVLN